MLALDWILKISNYGCVLPGAILGMFNCWKTNFGLICWRLFALIIDFNFQDASLIDNATNPQLTDCFQHTALVWVPCGFLFFFNPLLLYSVIKSKRPALPGSLLIVLKLVRIIWKFCKNFGTFFRYQVTLLLLIIDTGAVLFKAVHEWRQESRSVPGVDFLYPLLLCLAMVIKIVCIWYIFFEAFCF